MKKLILIAFIIYSQLSFGQSAQKINYKSMKISFVCAGSFIVAGAITNVIRTYQQEPAFTNYQNEKQYNNAIDKYKQKQTDFHRVSSMFYGFSGISLISISFDF